MSKFSNRVNLLLNHFKNINENTNTYTREEVSKHNKEDDCWIIIDKMVIDVTNFLSEHPGGKRPIGMFAGKDATEEFDMLHNRNVIKKYVPESILGYIKD